MGGGRHPVLTGGLPQRKQDMFWVRKMTRGAASLEWAVSSDWEDPASGTAFPAKLSRVLLGLGPRQPYTSTRGEGGPFVHSLLHFWNIYLVDASRVQSSRDGSEKKTQPRRQWGDSRWSNRHAPPNLHHTVSCKLPSRQPGCPDPWRSHRQPWHPRGWEGPCRGCDTSVQTWRTFRKKPGSKRHRSFHQFTPWGKSK